MTVESDALHAARYLKRTGFPWPGPIGTAQEGAPDVATHLTTVKPQPVVSQAVFKRMDHALGQQLNDLPLTAGGDG